MSGRGPALAECESCGRPIWRREYAERVPPLGEKCGGPIRRGGGLRKAAEPVRARRPVGDGDGQMDLFEFGHEEAG